MELTDLQKTDIKNQLVHHCVIELIKKNIFKPVPKPYTKNFIYETKCECCGSVLKENGEEKYKAAMKVYKKDAALKHEQFRFACCYETGLDFRVAPTKKAFDMAWSRGKAGLHDVYYELQELAELLLMT